MTTLKCDNPISNTSAHTLLRRLCQPAQVARLLRAVARQCGIEISRFDDVRIERCWPGRDGAYLFEWSFEADGDRMRLFGRWPADDAEDSGEAPFREPAPGDESLRSGVRCTLPRWQVTVFTCDRDPGMPQLAACLEPRRVAAIASLVSRETSLRKAHLLAYKPGRRATIHYELAPRGKRTATRHVAGKTFRDHRGRRLLKLHEQVRSQLKRIGAAVTAPAPLGYIKDLHLAMFEWIEVDGAAARRLGARNYVSAMADLHRIEVDDLLAHTVEAECAVTRQWHEHLRVMRPADADRFEPLVNELCRCAPQVAGAELCVIHRDYYERQLLAGANGPVLIDLDTLALGDRCVDLGNLAAHLALSRLTAGERVRPATLCREIADLYESSGLAANRKRLHYFAAASIFRVAAVHAVRTATRRCARPLAQMAAELLSIKLPSQMGITT